MPQPVRPITLPLIFPAWLPARDWDNKPLLFFMKRTQKATIKEKKWNHCEVLGNCAAFFPELSFDVCCELKKARGIVDDCPFPCLNTGVHIFIQCLWFNESDHLGGRFCLHRQSLVLYRTDWGHWDHKEQTSDEHGDNKSPSHSYPICGNTKKTMKDDPDRCVQLNHVEYSTPCHSISSVIFTDETLSLPQWLSLSLFLLY